MLLVAACEKCAGTAVVLVIDEVGAPTDPVAGWLMCDYCLATSEENGEWCEVVELEAINALPHSEYLGESATLSRIDARKREVRKRPPAATEEEIAEMARLYDGGMTLERIGEQLGFSQSTVYRHLMLSGHKMRSRGHRSRAAA